MLVLINGHKVLIDKEDLHIVQEHNWFYSNGYLMTSITCEGKRRNIGMHRLILGDPDCESIDHINHNRLDNRKCNLMPCTKKYNSSKQPKRKKARATYKGVTKHKVTGKWQVVIKINGKAKWFGTYETEEEAAKVAASVLSDNHAA